MAGDPPLESETTVMLREIALQPEFVRRSIASIVERTRGALDVHAGRRIASGFVIGCGDSFCAGLAARSYAMDVTQRWIEPVEALEFSRYLIAHLPPESFVFGSRTPEPSRVRSRACASHARAVRGRSR